MKGVDFVSWLLLVIGGINWGLIGFFEFNLVAAIFGGEMLLISRIVYALVGLSALYEIFTLKLIRERWTPICREEHVLRPTA
ncbi:MAG: DUF378 domain-containing protein [Candidatus Abyssobacteria bacterium SURF_5]|uniref:DUF378 domain-containing protein n=1 Tax=Abyssobacteria bacterium (strain SURF_5) TaxID=2093360 RepID=A0A3A4P9Z2_ABYX5|nr:MAG: DUF378 domain-containing protein [Candidatus Abyssubacteria bacterium SURF_5]